MKNIRSFIVVDDDFLNNIICTMVLNKTFDKVDTKTFASPEEGLAYIQKEYEQDKPATMLFLDINMPTISGWEFMKQYETFSEKIKEQITVYIVSSSVDECDKEKAEANPYVAGFISKPLEPEIILSLKEFSQQ